MNLPDIEQIRFYPPTPEGQEIVGFDMTWNGKLWNVVMTRDEFRDWKSFMRRLLEQTGCDLSGGKTPAPEVFQKFAAMWETTANQYLKRSTERN